MPTEKWGEYLLIVSSLGSLTFANKRAGPKGTGLIGTWATHQQVTFGLRFLLCAAQRAGMNYPMGVIH